MNSCRRFTERYPNPPGLMTFTGAAMRMARLMLEKETADDRTMVIVSDGEEDERRGASEDYGGTCDGCAPHCECSERQFTEADAVRFTVKCQLM
ncbi:unnamed protein product [Cylicostephanus goldi]|uniref:Uncharacterized protein n=1 Tax=Cylicostephanus goldi TaxID=71465 RepID=A0A3P6QWB3_CYLGO|nr:unnamed protein product [Cylicostephanus goldi]